MNAKQWDYTPRRERMKGAAISVGTIGAYGLALSQIFNAAAPGIALACGLAHAAYNQISHRGQGDVEDFIKDGSVTPLPSQYDGIRQMVDELARAAEIKSPISVYLINEEAERDIIPWYRDILSRIFILLPDISSHPQGVACALPAENALFISKSFQEKYTEPEQRFVLSHEIAHIKAEDSSSPYEFGKTILGDVKFLGIAALYIALGCALLSSPTLLPSVFAGGMSPVMGTALFGVATMAAHIALNSASRIVERRADRNAIHLTRDLDAATDILRKVNPHHQKPAPFIELSSHPSYHRRVANLHAAFEEASAYPPPLPAPARKAAGGGMNPPVKTMS